MVATTAANAKIEATTFRTLYAKLFILHSPHSCGVWLHKACPYTYATDAYMTSTVARVYYGSSPAASVPFTAIPAPYIAGVVRLRHRLRQGVCVVHHVENANRGIPVMASC